MMIQSSHNEEICDSYEILERMEMDYQARRIKVSEKYCFKKVGQYMINKSQIDSNGHLNNSQYIQIALNNVELIPKCIKRNCVEHKKQIFAGDSVTIFIFKAEDDTKMYIDVRAGADESCAMILLNK